MVHPALLFRTALPGLIGSRTCVDVHQNQFCAEKELGSPSVPVSAARTLTACCLILGQRTMRRYSFTCGLLLALGVLLAGQAQARPAKSSEDLQGASRRLLRAIDQPWGLPVTYNLTRFPDVAAVVGDTVTIHWNRTAGGQFSLWKIPSDDCPANFSSSADGQTQVVSLHQAGVATLKMTQPGVITFASSGPGQCNAGAIVNVVVSQGIIIPVDIAEAVNVTAPGPVPAPAPAPELTPKATPRRTSSPTPRKTTQPRG